MIFSISSQKFGTFFKNCSSCFKPLLKKVKALGYYGLNLAEYFIPRPSYNDEFAQLNRELYTILLNEKVIIENKLLSFNTFFANLLNKTEIARLKSELLNLTEKINNLNVEFESNLNEYLILKQSSENAIVSLNNNIEGVLLFAGVVATFLIFQKIVIPKNTNFDLPSTPDGPTPALPVPDLPIPALPIPALPVPDLLVNVDVLENVRRILEKFIPVFLEKIGQNPGLPPINTKSELVELLKIVKGSVHHYFSMASNPYFNSFELLCETNVEVYNLILLCIQKSEI